MYEYQRDRRFFAQIADDIKEAGSAELSELGARNVRAVYRGMYFHADKEALYRINYCARLPTRILAPLVSFRCSNSDQLYTKAKRIAWTDLMSPENTFAIFSNVSDSEIAHSHYASLRLKDGIVDLFREQCGRRPDVDARHPDVWFNLHIRHDRAVISLDTSGGSLHRRGYRRDAVSAPMQETVAAAIIRYTRWDGSVPLYDPMCGSGTLLSEALMHCCRIPAGYVRGSFGIEYLPDYDASAWTNVKAECDRQIRDMREGYISGSDVSSRAVSISRTNLRNLPQGEKVGLQVSDFRDHAGLENGIIVTNPPYGIRTGNRQELELLYRSLGDFLKQRCKGSAAYIYFGERELIKNIGLKPSWKRPLKSGGLDGRLVKYELF